MADVAASKNDLFQQTENMSMTTASIPLYPFYRPTQDSETSLKAQPVPGVTTTTIVIVASFITSCIIVACLGAAILTSLRRKRNQLKRLTDKYNVKQAQPYNHKRPETPDDGSVYSEIDSKKRCFCCVRKNYQYSVSSAVQVDNIYSEVFVDDIAPPACSEAPKDVIYETVDSREWHKSRPQSPARPQGQEDAPATTYDHLTFQELEKLKLGSGESALARKQESEPEKISSAYDRLDSMSTSDDLNDQDGNNNNSSNNNSLVRRLSQKQILKKLIILDKNNAARQGRSVSPRYDHQYFELEQPQRYSLDNESSSSDPKLPENREYFVLEDYCHRRSQRRRRKPPVPARTSSLGSAMCDYIRSSVPLRMMSDEPQRRTRSFPDGRMDFSSRDTLDQSAASSEGVYNISSGKTQRFSTHSEHSAVSSRLRTPRNDYFILDPVFLSSGASSECPLECENQDNVLSMSTFRDHSPRHDYFELEKAELPHRDEAGPREPVRFHIADDSADDVSRKHRDFGTTDSEGVIVVTLGEPCVDQYQDGSEENQLYDRIRFYSVSLEKRSDPRPRLFSTPNSIDF